MMIANQEDISISIAVAVKAIRRIRMLCVTGLSESSSDNVKVESREIIIDKVICKFWS